MAQTVLLKRSSVAGNVPGSSDLALGEIAVNTADGAVYIKKGNNDIVAVADNDILHIDTSNSRVGIGTTSPETKLHIQNGSDTSPAVIITGGHTGRRLKIQSYQTGGADGAGFILNADSSYGAIKLQTTSKDRLTMNNGGDISFYEDTGTTAKFFWDASTEKLGIGTTSAGAALTVHHALPSGNYLAEFRSTGNSHATIDLRADGTGDPRIFFDLNGATPFAIGVDNSDGDKFKISGHYQLGTNDRLVINSSGKVGIGTSSPSEKLTVVGETTSGSGTYGTKLTYSNGNQSGIIDTFGNHNLEFRANNDRAMNIAANGDISFYEDTGTTAKFFWDASAEALGLGTTSPDYALDIRDDSNIQLKLSSTTTTNNARMTYAINNVQKWNHGVQASDSSFTFYDIVTPSTPVKIEQGAANNTLVVDSNSRVGIGTNNPSTLLHLSSTYPAIRLTDSDGTAPYAQIINSSGILQLRADDNNSTANSAIQFYVDGGEKARINSSGNLLVGTTSAGNSSAGFRAYAGGNGAFTIAGTTLSLNRLSSNGEILNFQKDTVNVGSIGTTGGDLLIGTGNTGLLFYDASPQIIPRNTTGANVDATVDLGSTGSRFKDLHLSGTANVGTLKVIRTDNTTQYGIFGQDSSGGYLTQHRNNSSLYENFRFLASNTSGTVERARIDASGNLGIGTSSPNSLLHVSHATAPTFRLSRTGTGQVWVQSIDSNGRFQLAEAASEGGTQYARLQVDDTGEITFNGAYTFPTADGSANQVLKTDGSGNLTFATVSGGGGSTNSITDADGDTKIQVEESTDEDQIRFDAAGTERMRIGSDVQIIGTTDFNITGSNRRLSFTVGTGTVRTTTANSLILATNATTALTLDSSQVATFANHVRLADSKYLQLGSSQDFQIYHNGTNSYVRNYTGNLELITDATDADIKFFTDDGSGGLNEYLRIDGGADRTVFSRSSRHQDGVIGAFGTSEDLQIYHDGSNSYIKENGTGNLYLQGTSLIISNSVGANYLVAYDGGSVNLYHNANPKLATTSSGVQITGTLDVDVISNASGVVHLNDTLYFQDNSKAVFGDSSDLQIFHDGTDSHIQNTQNNGVLRIRSQETYFLNSDNNETQARFIENGAVTLYYDNAAKLATKSDGVDITGELQSDSLDVDGNADISGNLVLGGNLTVNGTQTTLNTATLTVDDLNITVADGAANSSAADGAGLTVAGAGASLAWNHANQQFRFNKDVFTPAGFIIGTTATNVGKMYNSSGVMALEAYSSRSISFGNATNGEHVRIDATGNVGIGTASPSYPLHVAGNIYSSAGDLLLDQSRKLIWGNSQQWIQASNNGQMKFIVNNGERFYIQTDGRYESRIKKHFRVNDVGNLGTTIRYYKIATVNKGNSGITIKGTLNNHVESHGTCKFDLAIFGREGNNSGDISVNGTVEAASADSGVRIVKQSGGSGYIQYDVYIVVPKYCHADVEATIHGNSDGTGNMIDWHGNGTYVTTAPTGAAVELNTSTLAAGHYSVIDSTIEMSLTPTGLGIGTTSPSFALDVQTANGNTLARFKDSDSSHSGIVIAGDTNAGWVGNDVGVTGEGIYYQSSNNLMRFYTNSTERIRIDASGRLGIKTTPSAWTTDYAVLDLNTGGSIYGTTSGVTTASNLYFTGSAWIAKNTGLGTLYAQHSGAHNWYSSASVSAGSAATLSTKMTLDASGNLGIGKTPSGAKLDVTTPTTGQLAARFVNTHSSGSYGISVAAGDDSGNYTASFTDKSGNSLMYIRGDGNVGIGTASPNALADLHVADTTDARIWLDATSGNTLELYAGSGVGLFNRSNNFLNFGTDNVERMRITDAGNVGIGTTSPAFKFSVDSGTSDWPGYFKSTDNKAGIVIADDDTTGYFGVESSKAFMGLQAGTHANNLNVMNTGKVGLGTTSPSKRLHVVDSASHQLQLQGSNSYWNIGTGWSGYYQDFLLFATSSGEKMVIDTAGKVGIGTNSPGYKLDLGGTTASTANTLRLHQNNGGTAIRIGAGSGSSDVVLWRIDGDSTNSLHSGSSDLGRYGFSLKYFGTGSGQENRLKLLSDNGGSSSQNVVYNVGQNGDINFEQKVGIGTNSPSKPLHVQFSGDQGVRIESENSHSSLYIDSHTGYGQYIRFSENNTNRYWLNSDINGRLLFRPGASGIEANLITFDASGKVGIGKTTVKAKLQVEEYGVDTTSTASSATTQIAIHSFAAADFRSARFTVQVTNSTDSTYHTTELLLVHDGTTANITEFGEIHTGSAVEATFDSDVNSGNVRLLATPASTDTMAFKVVCHSITT